MKILVMGLPGSGKTYLSERLVPLLNAAWYNADVVRKMANDWDFSDDGRDYDDDSWGLESLENNGVVTYLYCYPPDPDKFLGDK